MNVTQWVGQKGELSASKQGQNKVMTQRGTCASGVRYTGRGEQGRNGGSGEQ